MMDVKVPSSIIRPTYQGVDVATGAALFDITRILGACLNYDGTCIYGISGGHLLCLFIEKGSELSCKYALFASPDGGWGHDLSVWTLRI
jgi:hypothetical protein